MGKIVLENGKKPGLYEGTHERSRGEKSVSYAQLGGIVAILAAVMTNCEKQGGIDAKVQTLTEAAARSEAWRERTTDAVVEMRAEIRDVKKTVGDHDRWAQERSADLDRVSKRLEVFEDEQRRLRENRNQ